METIGRSSKVTECDKEALEQFLNTVKLTVKEIREFNSKFGEFLEQQTKLSKDLWTWVTRYNILNAGPPSLYPQIEREELLQEMLVKIQEKTSAIMQSLNLTKEHFNKLPQLKRSLESQSLLLNWDASKNSQIKCSIKFRPPSEYLEDIADVLFHYDVVITCMFQYSDALNLHDDISYENLMNSFKLSNDVAEFVKQFLIKNVTLCS